mgnify:CR=1 FL=1
MKKIICMFLTLLLSVCIVGCSQAKDSDNHVVQNMRFLLMEVKKHLTLWTI